jgi:hypothetical protein
MLVEQLINELAHYPVDIPVRVEVFYDVEAPESDIEVCSTMEYPLHDGHELWFDEEIDVKPEYVVITLSKQFSKKKVQ